MYGPFESENEAKAHPLHAVRARAVQDVRVLLLQASDAVIPDRDGGIVRIFADGGAALLDAATEVVGAVEAEETAVAAMMETSDGSTVDLQFNMAVVPEAGPRIFAAQRETGITLVLKVEKLAAAAAQRAGAGKKEPPNLSEKQFRELYTRAWASCTRTRRA